MKSRDGARSRSKSTQDNPRITFFTGDFRKQLIGLRSAEAGVFLQLCLAFWDMGPLPSDPADLAVLCPGETVRSFAKIWPKIQRKFLITDDGLVVEWLADNKIRQINFHKKQAQNGRLGGRPRNPVVSPGLTQTETQTEPTKKPPYPYPSTDQATNEDPDLPVDPSRTEKDPARAEPRPTTEVPRGHKPRAEKRRAPVLSTNGHGKTPAPLNTERFTAYLVKIGEPWWSGQLAVGTAAEGDLAEFLKVSAARYCTDVNQFGFDYATSVIDAHRAILRREHHKPRQVRHA